MKNKLLYFNALFDLELGGYDTSSLQRAAAEMTILFAPAGKPSDRIVLDIDVDISYWNYLGSYDIPTAVPFRMHDSKEYEGVAWGWNEQSMSRLTQLGVSCQAPSLTCVKLVNSRKFCNEIGLRLSTGVPGSVYCSNKQEVIKTFEDHKNCFPLVIKPDFGNSGFGFYHCKSVDDLQQIDLDLVCKANGVVVEPWCEKVFDFSSVCRISSDGTISPFRHCRALTNNRGTFHGIYLAEHDPVVERWKESLEEKVFVVAQEVAATGYFGTLGFDSIVYCEHNQHKLAAIIEINARHVMSDIAVAIRDSSAQGLHCLFRTLSKKRLRLPDSYPELQKHDLFRFDGRRGCILVSPLRVGHGKNFVQPYRNTIFIAADSENELFSIDERLRLAGVVC
jgi:hypothetical protein